MIQCKVVCGDSLIATEKWEAFVTQNPLGNIFQTPEIVKLYESTTDYEPVILFCIDDEGEICGLLVAYIICDGKRLLRRLSSRAIVSGGPLVNNGDRSTASGLISELKRKTERNVSYLQFRNLFQINEFSACFTDNGFTHEDHLDILIDLKKTEETLRGELHPTRRKQINRAIKQQVKVIVAEVPDKHKIEECYSILTSVYKRAGLPLPSLRFFIKAFEILGSKKRIQAFLAVHEGTIIGFRFVLIYKELIYDWFAGSRTEYNDRYPNDILPWSIMIWGKEQGFKTFDFGGAGHPGEKYGVRDYKLKFGGELVNFGRYLHVSRPLVYYPAKYYFKVKKNISRSESSG